MYRLLIALTALWLFGCHSSYIIPSEPRQVGPNMISAMIVSPVVTIIPEKNNTVMSYRFEVDDTTAGAISCQTLTSFSVLAYREDRGRLGKPLPYAHTWDRPTSGVPLTWKLEKGAMKVVPGTRIIMSGTCGAPPSDDTVALKSRSP
jgi:hypothetical protein